MRRSEVVVWGVVALALAGTVALAVAVRHTATPGASRREPEQDDAPAIVAAKTSELLPRPMGDLGDFACVERSGRSMKSSDLRGGYVIADFIFTSCGGPCPRMTEQMTKLQAAVKAMPDVRLATFTVDPDRDTPEVLAGYASRAGADAERWLFLRSDRASLVDVMCDRLKLVADRNDLLLHSTRFVLADPDGRAWAFYTPLEDEDWLGKLLRDLDTLRGRSAAAAPSEVR